MNKRIEFKVKENDYETIKKLADKMSLTVSAYVRLKALGKI